MNRHRQSHVAAFSLIEVFVIVAIVLLLVFVLVPSMANARNKAQRIDCVGNLQQVGLSFRIMPEPERPAGGEQFHTATSTNHGGTLEVSNVVWRTFLAMSNELGLPSVLFCPSDNRRPAKSWASLANSNISYFVGLDADEITPQLLLAGDRHLSIGRPTANNVLTIQTNDVAAWVGKTHQGGGNVAFADGSVLQLTSGKLQASVKDALRINLQEHTNATLRLAMPE